MRVLVCGGRSFGVEVNVDLPDEDRRRDRQRAANERRFLWETLDTFHVDNGVTAVIHGAQKGADSLARYWAQRKLIEAIPYPAKWKQLGNSAGPIRNKQMIDEGRPDVVIAFAGGKGTANMITQARASGIRVIEAG
jgi:hypothetical protein